jgi:hypothetical protein
MPFPNAVASDLGVGHESPERIPERIQGQNVTAIPVTAIPLSGTA